jgi:hypothetical protein
MYCPNCGNKSSTEQKFCRSCGLGLEKVTETLAAQLPMKSGENLLEQKNRLEQWGVAALSVFGLGVLVLFVYGIGYKLMLSQGKVWGGLALLGLLVMLSCGLLSVYLFARAKEVEQGKINRRIIQTDELNQHEMTTELMAAGGLEHIHSVTERTTELLPVEKPSASKRR